MKAALAICLILLSAPALAQGVGPRAEASKPDLRAFTLRNDSDQFITEATATSTKGTRFDLTKNSPIAPRRAMNFMMQANECLSSVQLRFKDGHEAQATGLNDCGQPQIFTDGTRITVGTEAGGPLIRTDK